MYYVILEKAKRVQVKPHQRRGKYVIGYQRLDPREAAPEAKERILYHVTYTDKADQIKKQGLKVMQTSNWVMQGQGLAGTVPDIRRERYGAGEIYAFDHIHDALRWAAKMDWEFNKKIGSGKISIVKFKGGEGWKEDVSDPLSQAGSAGKWLKKMQHVPAEDVVASVPFTQDHAKLIAGVTRGDTTVEDKDIFGQQQVSEAFEKPAKMVKPKEVTRTEIENEIKRLSKAGSSEVSLAIRGGQWLGRDFRYTQISNILEEKRNFQKHALKTVLEKCPEENIPIRKIKAYLRGYRGDKQQSWTVYGEKVMVSNRKSRGNTLGVIIVDEGKTPEQMIDEGAGRLWGWKLEEPKADVTRAEKK